MKTSKLVFVTLVLTVVCKMKRKQKISCFFEKSLLNYVRSFLTVQDIFKNFVCYIVTYIFCYMKLRTSSL